MDTEPLAPRTLAELYELKRSRRRIGGFDEDDAPIGHYV